MKPQKKFYAVAKGRTLGIFTEWSMCEDSINRYQNAVYKGFVNIDDAIHFLLANQTFLVCCDIPVFLDFSASNTVNDHEHSCVLKPEGGTVMDNTDPECGQEDGESVVIVPEGNEFIDSDTTFVKEGLPARGSPPCGSSFSEKTKRRSHVPSNKALLKGDITLPCSFCDDSDVNISNVIQCSDCHAWCHFSCTLLPPYQLYIYQTSTRRFKCEKCAKCPKDWISDMKKENLTSKSEPQLIQKYHSQFTQTDEINSITESEFISKEFISMSVQTDLGSNTYESTFTQTETDIGSNTYTSKCTQTEQDEMTMKTKDIPGVLNANSETQENLLESGMVKILDQISDINNKFNEKLNMDCCTTDTSPEINRLQTELKKAQKEQRSIDKETARLEKDFNEKQQKLQKEIDSARICKNKCEKEIMDVKLKNSQQMFDSEVEKAKLKSEIQIKEVKIQCQEQSIKILQKELSTVQTKFDKYCSESIELEEVIRNLKAKNSQLGDEALSLKMTLSADKRFGQNDTCTTTVKAKDQTNFPRTTVETTKNLSQSSATKNVEKTSSSPKKQNKNVGEKQLKEKTARTGMNGRSNSPKGKKNILVIGTSNTKYLSSRFMAGRSDAYINKVLKYSVKEAKEYIDGYEGIHPDIVTYLLTCNDIEKKSPDEIVNEMDELISSTNTVFGEKPIVVSLPLPREESFINRKTQQLTAGLINGLSKYKHVTLSDNTNLTYRGQPLLGILSDRKHLSQWGTEVLAKNLRDDFATLLSKRN